MKAVTFISQTWAKDPDWNPAAIYRTGFDLDGRVFVFDQGRPTFLTDAEFRTFERVMRANDEASLRFDVREADPAEVPPPVEYGTLYSLGDITGVIPSYKNLDLIQQAVESFKAFYPALPLIAVDDGSQDESTEFIASLPLLYQGVTPILLPENVTHGPALHAGMSAVKTRYAFTMDSDTTIRRGGMLEIMESRAVERDLFAIGMMFFQLPNGEIHGMAALWDMEKYRTLPPFARHGAPGINLFREVHRRGWGDKLENFHIFDYVTHWGGATRRRLAAGYWNPTEYQRSIA